jgi:excisionase family DNA binding protein
VSVSTDQRQRARKDDGVHPPVAPLLSIDDVATYLGVSPRWVYTQVRTARLPAMLIARSWRVRREAVDEFAESFRVDATNERA